MITEEELLQRKQEIDDAKNELAELKGEEKALLAQLKKDWSCETVADAEKKVKEMESNLEKLEDEIETLSEELEDEYMED